VQLASAGVNCISPVLNIVYAVVFTGTRGPTGDIIGQTIITCSGVGQLAIAIYNTMKTPPNVSETLRFL
jgi:hypothetical protein